MNHIEKRANLYYAIFTVPPDVRHIIGQNKFRKSTQTSNRTEAITRANLLVLGWRAEVAKARGTLPDVKDTFWATLRKDYAGARDQADEGAMFAIEELAQKMATKIIDPEASSLAYRVATMQASAPVPLGPLVEDWKGSLRLAQKTIDQQARDVTRMADHFVHLHALAPQKVKGWTDKLLAEGTTASSFERIGIGCRSFWAYLQQSGIKDMVDPDPFSGAFKLAMRVAVNNKTGRSGNSYTPKELAGIYVEATKGTVPHLADLIALGAYTGARIEELGRLNKETCKDGVFNFLKSKTDAGVRQCPIHPAVAPLVARMLAASTDGFLIPSKSKNKYGTRVGPLGQNFGRLKTRLGFGPAFVFHSTRNTLSTLMEQAGVPEGIAADVVGHDKATMTYGLYSSGSSRAQKVEAMAKVSFPAPLDRP